MALTDPFVSGIEKVASAAHRQVFRATAVSGATRIDLDVETYRLGWDERRAPRVGASLICKVPDDQATIDLLDPRTGCRVEITAGYVLPGGVENAFKIADLGLRRRQVGRPDNRMTLTLASDEALAIDGSPAYGFNISGGSTPLAMQALLNSAMTPDPAVVITHPDNAATTVNDVQDRWATVDDLADVIGADVYDNGLRTFYITPRPTVASLSAATLKVGTGGTITGSDAVLDRDDWANYVSLRYRWRNAAGVDQQVIGTATVASGPFAPATTGLKIYTEDRNVPASVGSANAAAKAVLARFLSRSRSYTLSAVSYWWLRPGMTVTVQLPTGNQERHLVASVEFTDDGSMTVTTRLPDNASVIGE